MTDTIMNDEKMTRTRYETPRLTVHGSVRNLTGGSGSSFRDGSVTNVRF